MKRLAIITLGLFAVLILGLIAANLVSSIDFTGIRIDAPIAEAHERAVNSFIASDGFGVSRLRRKHRWNEEAVVVDGYTCIVWEIHLIGLTEELGDRYFVSERYPRKRELANAQHRSLNDVEAAAVVRLRAGEPLVTISDGSATNGVVGFPNNRVLVRVFGAITAREECLKCHTVKVGELLGALDYQFVQLESYRQYE